MKNPNGTHPPHPQVIDSLFARPSSAGQVAVVVPPPSVPANNLTKPQPVDTLPLGEIQPPPSVKNPADVQAAYLWLQRERERLEAYTRSQFERLQEEHRALLSQNYVNEQKRILRIQELNQKTEALAAQHQSLQQQARALAEREQEWASRADELAKSRSELAELRQAAATLRAEADAERPQLEQLRAETATLQTARDAARGELTALEDALREQRLAWDEKHTRLAAWQAEMELRSRTLENAEASMRRRTAELEELEEKLATERARETAALAKQRMRARSELKELRLAVAAFRAEIEAGRPQMEGIRTETASLEAARDVVRKELALVEQTLVKRFSAWRELQAQLTARREEAVKRVALLKTASESMHRKVKELDELEGCLQREMEESEQPHSKEPVPA
jgi:chromosome segregation ATPase